MRDFRRLIVPLVVLASSLAAGSRAPAQEAAVSEEAAVECARALYAGRWKIVDIESDGESKPGDAREVIVINRADGTWTMSVDELEVGRGESRIDPLADPPAIDVEITSGDGRGNVLHGIYEVTETRRRLCFRGEQGWRPREFRTKAGDGAALVTFERQPDDWNPP